MIVVELVGEKYAKHIEELAITLYTAVRFILLSQMNLADPVQARDYAAERGIIIADTKFEFGLNENDEVVLVDEVLTPGKQISKNNMHQDQF